MLGIEILVFEVMVSLERMAGGAQIAADMLETVIIKENLRK